MVLRQQGQHVVGQPAARQKLLAAHNLVAYAAGSDLFLHRCGLETLN